MKIEDHLRNIRESLEVMENSVDSVTVHSNSPDREFGTKGNSIIQILCINESIQKIVQERQRNIGFNISVAATEMLEVFLHKNNLINFGTILKHDWFTSPRKAEEKLGFDSLQLGLIPRGSASVVVSSWRIKDTPTLWADWDFYFSNKKEILFMLNEIESKRNILCYGKPQPKETIESLIKTFNNLKDLFDKEGLIWN